MYRVPRSAARLAFGVVGWSSIELLHEFIHKATDETDGADRLRVSHSSWSEHTDHAHCTSRLPVRGQNERDVLHLGGFVFVADQDLHVVSRCNAAHEGAQVIAVLERDEDTAQLFALAEFRLRH